VARARRPRVAESQMNDRNETPEFYRRRLPHFQPLGKPVFVTFNTYNRIPLPEAVRSKVIEHCLKEDKKRIDLFCVVVMPDHVHMILDLLADNEGKAHPLQKIMKAIKNFSALSINKILKRSGPLWQDESMDHNLRSDEQGWVKVEYIIHNPVRAKICQTPADYPWLWVNESLLELRGLPDSVRKVIERRQETLSFQERRAGDAPAPHAQFPMDNNNE
jgi:putative transposase